VSPTLSPTQSAMTAGLRGSSSGMPASTWGMLTLRVGVPLRVSVKVFQLCLHVHGWEMRAAQPCVAVLSGHAYAVHPKAMFAVSCLLCKSGKDNQARYLISKP
jgi:hypothetical protein